MMFAAKIMRVIPYVNLSMILLMLACLAYGIGGAPTPSSVGLAEMFIGFVLVLLVLMAGGLGMFKIDENRPLTMWSGFCLLLILYGLTVPFVLASVYDNGMRAVLRDLIGFCFFLIPLLIGPYFARHKYAEHIVTGILVVTGMMFACRFIYSIYQVDPTLVFANTLAGQGHVDITIANAPTVLFAAIFLSCVALETLGKGLKSQILSACLLVVALIPAVSALLALQRASLVGVMLSLLFTFVVIAGRQPQKAFFILLCGAIMVLCFLNEISFVLQSIIDKTRLVGLNSRYDELVAVSNNLGEVPYGHYTGRGWGASFLSPAAGFKYVTYTHNFFSGLWLKCGVPGVILGVGFIAYLARFLLSSHLIRKRPSMWCAMFFPLVINLFFYANHKSFDFGLILLLISIYSARYSASQESENAQ